MIQSSSAGSEVGRFAKGRFHSITRLRRPAWLRFGVAVLAVAAAWGLRCCALKPLVGPTELPFIFFFPAVLVAAAFGGFRAGLFAIFLAVLAARWSFFTPFHSLSIPSWSVLASLFTFIVVSLAIAVALDRVHRDSELLVTTLGSIGDGVIVTDAEGRITFLNPKAAELTGWNLSEAGGKSLEAVFRILREETGEPAENPVTKVIRTGTVTGLANHTNLVQRSGALIPIDDSAAPIFNVSGQLAGIVLVFRDITEKRIGERAASRLGAIVENSEDAIIGKDLNGTITNWNKGAERIFGYSAAEIIGKSMRTLIPEDRQFEEDKILKTLQRGERVEYLETIRKHKSGDEIQVSLSSSPIKDNEGQIIGASQIAHDISRRKAMETELAEATAELQDYARNLELTVAERTAYLQATIAELESVSYSLSHDMRAPLRAIHSFSQIVLDEAGNKLSTLERDLLQRCVSAANRLDRLIQDVLTYSRVGREKIELKTIDVETLVRQIIEERPDLQPPRAQIEIKGPLEPVLGHEAYLSQCITNLLDNAVKFVSPGKQPRVEIWSETKGDNVCLSFQDNGIGIPKEAQERIFGLFQRMHPESHYPGTGVGLSIVRKAVERMDGQVGIDSEPGKGSRFWLQLQRGHID